MNTNSFFIKFTGKANIPDPLELDAGYTVTITGEVPSSTDISNQDGTKDVIYKFVPILAEITDAKGKVVKVKDTRKMSEKFRRVLHFLWENDTAGEQTPEQAYERTMNYCITHAQELYDASRK